MPRVTFTQDKKTVEATEGERLVDVAFRAEASIPFGCQDGRCGTCLSTIVHGRERLDLPSEKERTTLAIYGASEQHRLVCQCVVRGDVEIDEP